MNKQRTKHIIAGLLGICFLIGNVLSASVKPNNSHADDQSLFSYMEHPVSMSSSAAVDKLQDDVAEFDKTLNTYIAEGQKVDNDIQIVLKGLDLIDKMASDLQKLDNGLTTVEKLIIIAKDIPQTEKAATTLSNGMETIHPSVTRASNAVNNFNNKITPARKNLEDFDAKLQKLITAAQNFEKRLNVYTADITKAQQCINSLPEGSANWLMHRINGLCKRQNY
jgi:DNA repair ATPase RecN